ncbi:MAG TPA: hypothetical protein VFS43_10480 [Polyangiaceae bacterium]|nr:hypothetical protein [Polyangiaceae bacterium]
MSSERSRHIDPGDTARPPSPAGPAEGGEARRLAESADRARASIVRARAKLDGVMQDVRALPDALKTNVCHIIEHAFDELLAAERELTEALRACANESQAEADQARPP